MCPQVCGGDGVTYDSICVLRSRATTRLDYMGECGGGGMTREQHCQAIRNSMRCLHNSSNCQRLVQPRVGCCPVCGKSLFSDYRKKMEDVLSAIGKELREGGGGREGEREKGRKGKREKGERARRKSRGRRKMRTRGVRRNETEGVGKMIVRAPW